MGIYHDDPNTNQGANLAPWAALSLEQIVFNADVSEFIRARGL